MASSTGTEGLGPCWQACPIDPETKSRAMDCAVRQAETHTYVNHTLLCSDTCVRVLGSPPTRNPCLWRHGCHPTMISMELQRDVPQYMAIPWLMTWVMARTVSVREKGKHGLGRLGFRPSLGMVCRCRWGCQEEGAGCKGILQAVYFLAPRVECGCWGAEIPGEKKMELKS